MEPADAAAGGGEIVEEPRAREVGRLVRALRRDRIRDRCPAVRVARVAHDERALAGSFEEPPHLQAEPLARREVRDPAEAVVGGQAGRRDPPPQAAREGGEEQREMARRFGVNLVMYALTGNYKTDQVHVPALLERLGQ